MRTPRRTAGQVVVLTTVALVAAFGGFAGLGDIGFLKYRKQNIQAVADSAALAAAGEANDREAIEAALTDAASNGFHDAIDGVTVTVNHPPRTGRYSGNSQYVEVIVAESEPTFFTRVLGVGKVNVNARAVAVIDGNPDCIYALARSASAAFLANANLDSSCGLVVDSSSRCSLRVNDNALVSASAIVIAGNYSAGHDAKLNPKPEIGAVPAPDPLAYVEAPSVGACTYSNDAVSGDVAKTLSPGVYCGGITISGNATVTFGAGTYILAGGGMTINGDAKLAGSGITFYNTKGSAAYGPIVFDGNIQANLSAPTSGPLAGVLFFQDRSIGGKGSIIKGSASSTFDGALYFPTTALSYSGSSSATGYTIIVASEIAIDGNSEVKSNYASLAGGSPVKLPMLAE